MLSRSPLVSSLRAGILNGNDRHEAFFDAAVERLSEDEIGRLGEYIGYCTSSGLDLAELAVCYETILEDTLKEQLYFVRHKKYRYTTFSEVAESVYHNPEYMRRYMHGLALTSFIWPNHVDMRRFFEKTLPKDRSGSYLEVGPGHGLYFMTAMRLASFDRFTGIDISPTSIEMSERIVRHFFANTSAPVDFLCRDFLDQEPPRGPFGAIVMGEVLEHIERPEAFLKRIAEICDAETYVYVTTCVNAPAIDHIYLFRMPEEVEDMIRDAGLAIRESYKGAYFGKSFEESLSQELPINVAYVLARER